MIQQGQDISKMSLLELKAMAYDLIAVGENNARNLQVVNQAIQQKSIPEVKPEGGVPSGKR